MRPTAAVLKALEEESIEILRETAATFANPVMLYSIGKDSSVLLHLAMAENEKSMAKIRQLRVEILGDLELASKEPIPVGENSEILEIPIEVAAEAILGSSSRSIKRMAGSLLFKELLLRLKYKGLRIKRKII